MFVMLRWKKVKLAVFALVFTVGAILALGRRNGAVPAVYQELYPDMFVQTPAAFKKEEGKVAYYCGVFGGTENPSIEVKGTAVLQDGKLIGSFTPDETRGLLWASGEIGKTQMFLEDPSFGMSTLDVVQASLQVQTKIIEGNPHYELLVRLTSNVTEEENPAHSGELANRYSFYEQMQKELVEAETTGVLATLFYEMHCDAIGLCNFLIQQQPSYWMQHGENYEKNLANVTFQVLVDAKIHKVGLSLS